MLKYCLVIDMEIIGIITEYNPFHNGHLYHINEIKKLYPNSLIICVMSGSFCQRGDISIINKWAKTEIALENNIDIVVELPFPFATQSADIFAKGAIAILNQLKVNKIIFGSELNNIEEIKKIVKKQLNDKSSIKKYLNQGLNYPTALSKSLDSNINTPNDLLAISYVKQIMINNYQIEAITIKRTNNYHDTNLNNKIVSASSIRSNLNNKNIKKYLPIKSYKNIYKIDNDYCFNLLKYKIISNIDNLNIFQTVDEGIENKIKKCIYDVKNKEQLIKSIKSKRYTYNRINRMLTHILTSFTKDEANRCQNIEYIKILGFNDKGRNYLNKIKKEVSIPIITSYKYNSLSLTIEYRVSNIYSLITKDANLIKKELQKPIIK